MFLFAALMSACSRDVPTRGDGLISDRGVFSSPSGSSQLVVGSSSKSLVDYKIVDVETKREFKPNFLFSDAMRWAAFWQDDDTLWVQSSDIGLSVWKRDTQGDFSHILLGERKEMIQNIPTEIWDFMPSSSKRRWEQLRNPESEPSAGENASRLTP